MKTSISGLLLLSLTLSLGAAETPPIASSTPLLAPDGNANFRTWTNTTGKKVEASFRGIESGNIFLQTRDGYVYRLALDTLIPEDQKLAQSLKPEGLGIPKDPGLAQAAAIIDKGVLMGLTKAGQKPNPLASDEQFIRRVYLDLAGRIPTREEALAFINDTSSSKRASVIDTLINDDGFTSRMYNYMSDMLRVTDDAQKSKFFTYQEWLKQQIADNRPWNLVVREMMTADGKLLENGATGYLLRDRGMRLDNLSLTLSTFLGANVACAQCHDHPFADWTQRQFYEMAAFFGASDTYNNRKGGGALGMNLRNLREELGQQAFAQARRLMYANQLKIADGEKNDTTLPDDYKYVKDGKPGDAVAPKLISWTKEDHRLRCYQNVESALKKADDDSHLREVFADWMTSPDNPRFAMTISNRLWKLAFGVGIKEPVTDLDDPNASSNPALIHHLANEMVRLKFDLRAFMRLLCNTQTYQREAVTAELAMGQPFYFPGPILRRMTAEQAWDSCVTLAIGDKVDHFKMKRADTYAQVMNLGSAELSMEVLKEKLDAMQNMRQSSMFGDAPKGKGAKKKGKRAAMMREASATNNEEEDYSKPQMMGGLVLARASELRQPEREDHFLRMFGQSDRQIADSNSEEGSVPQVLMLMNGEAQEVLSSRQAMAVSAAEKQESAQGQVESLYLSFFSRKPTAEELKSIYEDINNGLKPGDLAWVLFNSREFVFVQ
ncbi:DUF1549 domain-containing protein [Brevifollis gellanilyticus]|uniref:DUF1549 domain-containing protein n=1 Tax=Brevifollis gellanilyticus TaxID=748831 RepID=A0A512M8J2_9BACT|nr:DUF1549 domain-containing protein [Brevifollis gellanilyticus]GEP43047.1 hypothetical protein BGE01nite_23380 [Brevifollis gellanilyticus]